MNFAIINIPNIKCFRMIEKKLLKKYKWYKNSPGDYLLSSMSFCLLSIVIQDNNKILWGSDLTAKEFCDTSNITKFIKYNNFLKEEELE